MAIYSGVVSSEGRRQRAVLSVLRLGLVGGDRSVGERVPFADLFLFIGQHGVPVIEFQSSGEHERTEDQTTDRLVCKKDSNTHEVRVRVS